MVLKKVPSIMSKSASPRKENLHDIQVRLKNQAVAKQKATKAAEDQKVRDYYAKNGHMPTILANESRTHFDEANAVDVADLGRKVALGLMTRDQALAAARGGTAHISDINRRAGLSVNAEIDPAELAIKNNIAFLNSSFDKSQANAKAVGTETVGRQKALYDYLAKSIAMEPDAIRQNYGQTSQQVGQNYDAALAATQGNYANAQSAGNAEAARLGLEAATPVANAQNQGDAAFLQGLLQSQKTGAQSTLAGLQQADINSANQFGRAASAESSAVQAGTLGDLAIQQQQALNEKLASEADLNSQTQQLEAGRKPKLYEAVQALMSARQQAIQDEEDRQFDHDIANRTLGVKEYGAQTDRQKVEIAARKSDAELQKIARESIPGTLEYETAMAAIDLKKSQAAAALSNAKTNQQNANTKATQVTAQLAAANDKAKQKQYGKGMLGVQNYLHDAGVDDQTFAMIMKHVNNTIITHDNGDYKNGLRGVEGYITAHKLPANIANAFRVATAIAYGKSGN